VSHREDLACVLSSKKASPPFYGDVAQVDLEAIEIAAHPFMTSY